MARRQSGENPRDQPEVADRKSLTKSGSRPVLTAKPIARKFAHSSASMRPQSEPGPKNAATPTRRAESPPGVRAEPRAIHSVMAGDLGAAKQSLACCAQYGIPTARSAPGQPQKNCTGEGAPTGNLQVSFVRPSSVQAVALVGSTIVLTGLGGGAWPSVICSIMFARRVGTITLPLP